MPLAGTASNAGYEAALRVHDHDTKARTGIDVLFTSSLLGCALRFVFTSTLAMTAFWTERAAALVPLGNTVILLLGGIAAPLFLPRSPPVHSPVATSVGRTRALRRGRTCIRQ